MALETGSGLGIIISMDEANDLNNNFQRLWRNANDRQRKEMDPIMEGWVIDYNRWRDSYIARATEWGKLSGWQKRYETLRLKFIAEGTHVTAPVIVPGQKPGDVTVDIPDIPDIPKPEEIGKETKGVILLGVGAVLVAGLAYYFVTRR